jgi:two-component system, NarL family, nitrate/nitrite response regulator NarL
MQKTLQLSPKKTIPTLLIAITDKLKAEFIASLESKNIFKSAGIINDGQNLFEILESQKPDFLLIDTELPNNAKYGFLKKLGVVKPETKVIIYSTETNPDYLRIFLSSPASGYIQQGCGIAEFINTLSKVFSGEKTVFYYESDIKKETYLQNKAVLRKAIYDLSLLTERQKDIWELLMESKSEKEIAEILFISKNTVKTHKSDISKKLGIKNEIRLSKIGNTKY